MTEAITVHVVKYPDRKNLVMRYTDPTNRKQVQRSTGTDKQKEAAKVAAKWESELREGRYKPKNRIGWDEFRDRHFEEHLADLSQRGADGYVTALNAFEKYCRPHLLSDATTERVSQFRAGLRKAGRKPATVAAYLRHLKAALTWAHRHKLLVEVPDCTPPKGSTTATTMKGRPVTGEEFERMLAAVPKVVKPDTVEAWRFYLKALWLSGLRLTESLTLTWDDDPNAISVDLRGRRPMLRIPAAVEKGRKNRILPITPDFAELLETVPQRQRRGKVFPIPAATCEPYKVISKVGKTAGVRVNEDKFASAHDLRRAFGTRWSKRLTPARLKALMRHADISTTMRFYVAEESEELADALFEAAAKSEVPSWVPSAKNASAGTRPETQKAPGKPVL